MSDAIKTAKSQAEKMATRLKQLGVEIKRTQCLEAIAAINNYPDWNRFSAAMVSGSASTSAIAPAQVMERYIVGGVSDSLYARRVFTDALTSWSPVYVELKSGSSRPFKMPSGREVSRIEIMFDWDGNITNKQAILGWTEQAAKLAGGPLHISVQYDETPEREAHKSGRGQASGDRAAYRERINSALAKVLEDVRSYLAIYCPLVEAPLVIIDDARSAGHGPTSIGRMVGQAGKDRTHLIGDLMGVAPSVLFICSETHGHVAGGRLGIKSFDVDLIGSDGQEGAALLSAIKRAFSAYALSPGVEEVKKQIHGLMTTCQMAGVGFKNKQELIETLICAPAWEAEFVRLVDTDDELVSVEVSNMNAALAVIGRDLTFYKDAARDFADNIGDWAWPAIERLMARIV